MQLTQNFIKNGIRLLSYQYGVPVLNASNAAEVFLILFNVQARQQNKRRLAEYIYTVSGVKVHVSSLKVFKPKPYYGIMLKSSHH
jgi:uncharacterized LabA/DUF88 family protein